MIYAYYTFVLETDDGNTDGKWNLDTNRGSDLFVTTVYNILQHIAGWGDSNELTSYLAIAEHELPDNLS